MTDEQETRLHMAALDYRGAHLRHAEEQWQILVSVVLQLMDEAAAQSSGIAAPLEPLK